MRGLGHGAGLVLHHALVGTGVGLGEVVDGQDDHSIALGTDGHTAGGDVLRKFQLLELDLKLWESCSTLSEVQ